MDFVGFAIAFCLFIFVVEFGLFIYLSRPDKIRELAQDLQAPVRRKMKAWGKQEKIKPKVNNDDKVWKQENGIPT